jgi:nitrate/nitrite transporter NarK
MNADAKSKPWQRWLTLASLMLAGEAIFMLPYMRKTFQTSLEEVFHISSTELGFLNAAFGILALICYFPGGWLADRFSARRLLTFSLLATGAGGLFMLSIPSYPQLLALHAFWGVTAILTFWAALIKATRMWGDDDTQGMSFGLLEGGRGAVAALLATIAAAAFAAAIQDGTARDGLTAVLIVYTAAPMLAGIAVWLLVPETAQERAEDREGTAIELLRHAIALPQVWFIAAIIFLAYLAYTGSYYFPAYAERGLGADKTFGATLGAFRDWLRPVAAIAAGLIADRIGIARSIAIGFSALALLYASLWLGVPASGETTLLLAQVAAISLLLFGLRGIYFALMGECRIPMGLTGITVGIVSVIAYTPDIFAHLVAGWFLDSYAGGAGFRYYYGVLAGVALLGLSVTLALRRLLRDAMP